MPKHLCACYKCVTSGRSWTLTIKDILSDRDLVAQNGKSYHLDDLMSSPDHLVALYFGASFNHNCRAFSAILEKVHGQANNTLDIVYVSSDKNRLEMRKFMASHPGWLALQYGDQAILDLHSYFSIRCLPSLVVLNSSGVVSRSGHHDVARFGDEVCTKWRFDAMNTIVAR